MPLGKMQPKTLRQLGFAIGLGMAGMIFYYSVLTLYIPRSDITHIDKAYHAISYGILMAWWAQLYSKPHHAKVFIGATLFGVLIEFIQPYTGRSFDLLDMLANTTGALIAWILVSKGGGHLLAPVFIDKPEKNKVD